MAVNETLRAAEELTREHETLRVAEELTREHEALRSPTQPPPAKQPAEEGFDWQAALMGLSQTASVGLEDEATGVIQANADLTERNLEALAKGLETGDWSEAKKIFSVDTLNKFVDRYRHHRDANRREHKQVAERSPWTYGVSAAVGALPAAIATGGTSAKAMIGAGAAQGLNFSEADLTRGEVKGAATDATIGAGLSAVGAAFPRAARVGFPALGAGMALFGDEMGLSKADRVAAGTGAAFMLPGVAGDALEGLAARAAGPNRTARAQLSSRIAAEDTAADSARQRAAIASARAEEDATFKAQQDTEARLGKAMEMEAELQRLQNEQRARQAVEQGREEDTARIDSARAQQEEAARQQRIAQLEREREALLKEMRARAALEEGRAADEQTIAEARARAQRAAEDSQLERDAAAERGIGAREQLSRQQLDFDTYEGERGSANKDYRKWLRSREEELATIDKLIQKRASERAKLLKEIEDADALVVDLNERADNAAAKAFDVAATKIDRWERITGKPLPKEIEPVQQKVAQSYEKNAPKHIVDPDLARERFRAREAKRISAMRQSAEERLRQHDDEIINYLEEARKLLQRPGSRVTKEEAYRQAQELGLNPGPFDTFEVLPPPEGWQLTKPAPPTPEPGPSRFEVERGRLYERMAERLAAQERQEGIPKPRTAQQILAEYGLEAPRTSQQKRLEALEARLEQMKGPGPEPLPARRTEAQILGEAGVEAPLSPAERRIRELPGEIETLRNPPPEAQPTRAPEEEILRAAGLDKPPADRPSVAQRMEEQISRAGPRALERAARTTGGGFVGGGVAGQVLDDFIGPTGGAVVGGVLGARQALRALSAVDVKTGQLKDPASVAAVYGSLERVLSKYPDLGRKYLPGFRRGLNPLEVGLLLMNDSELRQAFDRESGGQPAGQGSPVR